MPAFLLLVSCNCVCPWLPVSRLLDILCTAHFPAHLYPLLLILPSLSSLAPSHSSPLLILLSLALLPLEMHMFHQASLKLGLDRAVLAHARNEQVQTASYTLLSIPIDIQFFSL